MSGKKLRQSHVFEREQSDHYVEQKWCSRRLFEAEPFKGFVHDPCCGWGRIPEAARAAGIKGVTGSDIVHRGFEGCGVKNFLEDHELRDNIVFNPPFKIFKQIVTHALSVSIRKVVALAPTKIINAAHWMPSHSLQHIWFLTPRPSMPPGDVVEQLLIGLAGSGRSAEPTGDTKDYCWMVFDNTQRIKNLPTFGWLHRDKGIL